MTKYYFLIGAILYGLYGHSQGCDWVDFLESDTSWSGNIDHFDRTGEGWTLADSAAGTTLITLRPHTPTSSVQLTFSLNFPPSGANMLQVEFGLGTDRSSDSSSVVLTIGESGSEDGLQASWFAGTRLVSEQEFWPGEYGEGAIRASWIVSLDQTGITIQNGGRGEVRLVGLSDGMQEDLSIQSISIRCEYTKTRSSHFTFHNLYNIPNSDGYHAFIEPGELFISEYRFQADVPKNFIELYNFLPESGCYSGLRLRIGDQDVILPPVRLEAGKHTLVVNRESTISVDPKVNVIPIDFPDLSQSQSRTILLFSFNKLLHGTNYFPFTGSPDSGSIEMIDISQPCRTDNWKISKNASGSPGADNGWFTSLEDPSVNFYWESAQTGIVAFPYLNLDKTISQDLLKSNYPFELINSNIWGEISLNFQTDISLFDSVAIEVNGEFSGCSPSRILWDTMLVSFPPGLGREGGLLITELMYEPTPGCPEYLEITNMEDMDIWWGDLQLQKNESKPIVVHGAGIWPASQSRVFSTDRHLMLDCYDETSPELVFEMDLFVLNNNGAELTLRSEIPENRVIDRIQYEASAHNQVFNNTSGVALERNILGTQGNNWRSGFVQFGYRSPGFLPEWDLSRGFEVGFSTSAIYSKSGLGPSFLEISVGSESLDGSMTIEIFDLNGKKIQTLANAVPVQGGEIFTWDGRMSNGRLLPEGLYLFWIYFYDLPGHRKIIKRTCVLSNN